jgi:uncharacterized protein
MMPPPQNATAREIIAVLGMRPHPEGGWYAETYRDPDIDASGRAFSSLIYFLLAEGEVSAWHRVDATEVWHWHAGAPLALTLSPDGMSTHTIQLGADLAAGERPQGVVPVHCWQMARSLGAWTLVGCTVAPAFRFEGFELAPVGWEPGKS